MIKTAITCDFLTPRRDYFVCWPSITTVQQYSTILSFILTIIMHKTLKDGWTFVSGFCDSLLKTIQLKKISNQATFTNHGQVNRQNVHYWVLDYQHPCLINTLCGIYDDTVSDFIFYTRLNGQRFRYFLRNNLQANQD